MKRASIASFRVAYSENKAQGEAFFDAEYGANFTAAVPGAFYSGELKHLEAEGRIRPLEIERPGARPRSAATPQ
jgi:hypothetical protein